MEGPMATFKDLPVLSFETPADWRAWLAEHHAASSPIYVRLFKKGSGMPSISYAEALDEALCYGWIDSTKNAYDAESYLQRFGPRKARSIWSQVNRDHVARLIDTGRMTPAGQAMIDEAKRNGEWETAYASFSDFTLPDELETALAAHPEARAHYESLNKTNRYAIYHRVHTAKKPETRQKRVAWAIDLLLAKGKVH
jgi:uncharacterized protein YdeI (YjbR/CyaY-like superfamily)